MPLGQDIQHPHPPWRSLPELPKTGYSHNPDPAGSRTEPSHPGKASGVFSQRSPRQADLPTASISFSKSPESSARMLLSIGFPEIFRYSSKTAG